MIVLGLHHAQITIPKDAEDKARLFYGGCLGLKEIDKPAVLKGRGGFWLQLPGLQIHVGTEGDVDRSATKAHLAYEVADLSVAKQAIEAQGLVVIHGPEIPGCMRFESRDPFGNRLEFVQRLASGKKAGFD